MRDEGGFGIVTVMAGAVVLGIFALVYTQQMRNRASITLIGDLVSFREQVITYYASVISNRNTWECTVWGNSALGNYLRTGSPRSGPLVVYKHGEDCQEDFLPTPAPDPDELIGGSGLGLRMQDYNNLPIDGATSTCDTTQHFCLEAEWRGLTSNRHVEVKLTLTANRTEIKNDLGVNFDLADKEHAVYLNRTVGKDCSEGRLTGHYRGTGKGVLAYAGDSAVVNFDSYTGLVECSSKGPLVVPPCYDLSGDSDNPFTKTGRVRGAAFAGIKGRSFPGTAGRGLRCGAGATKGSCPATSGGGTTAIAFFDPWTGISQCSHPNILVNEVEAGFSARHCSGENRYGIVRISDTGTFTCSTAVMGGGTGGVEPEYCDPGEAIRGFGSTGLVTACVPTPTGAGPRGFRGPRGEQGDTYPGPQGAQARSFCDGSKFYEKCDNLRCPLGWDKSGNLCDPPP